MLVEAFCNSEEQGMRFLKFCGDGDSSVMARIKERCPYGYKVEKVPCKNHAVRCYKSGLYSISLNSVLKHTDLRKLLRQNIDRLVKSVNCAIAEATKDDITPQRQKVDRLIAEFRNGLHHVFGDHTNCAAWCQRKELGEENMVPELQEAQIYYEIAKKLDYLIAIADNLRSDRNTNFSECFMSVNNKFQGAKRICRSKKRSYQGRTHCAALRFQKGPGWFRDAYKNVLHQSPNKVVKKLTAMRERREEKSAARRKLHLQNNPEKRKRNKACGSSVGCTEYGPNAAKPDLPNHLYEEKKNEILNDLKKEISTEDSRRQLFQNTIGQFSNRKYKEAKRYRLTASNFGSIMKTRSLKSVPGKVNMVVYPKNIAKKSAIVFGKTHEPVARRKYEFEYGADVRESGLCTNAKYPTLGASPDGIVGEHGIIEIKCLENVYHRKLREFVEDIQSVDSEGRQILIDGKKKPKDSSFSRFCLEIGEDNKLHLKKECLYYFQV
jgi:hypothetical protein